MSSPFDGVAEPPELLTENVAEPTNVIPFPDPPEPPELLDVATTPVHFPVLIIAREGEEVRPVRIADLLSPAQRVAELVEALQGALVAPEQEAELERLVAKANCLEVTDAASMQVCSELYEMLHANEKGIEDGDIGKVVAFFHRPWKAMTTFRGRFLNKVIAAKARLSDVGGAWNLAEKRRAEEKQRQDEQAEAEKERERLRQQAAAATKAGDVKTAAVVEEMVKEVTPTALPLVPWAPAMPTKGRASFIVDQVDEDAFYKALVDDPTRRVAAPVDLAYLNRQAKDLGTDMPKRFPGVTVKEKGGLSAGGRR